MGWRLSRVYSHLVSETYHYPFQDKAVMMGSVYHLKAPGSGSILSSGYCLCSFPYSPDPGTLVLSKPLKKSLEMDGLL